MNPRDVLREFWDGEYRKLNAKKPDFQGFVQALMDGWPEPHGEGLDGFELQELAARFGVLRVDKRRTPCGEYCRCNEYHGPGEIVDCYRLNYVPRKQTLMSITPQQAIGKKRR